MSQLVERGSGPGRLDGRGADAPKPKAGAARVRATAAARRARQAAADDLQCGAAAAVDDGRVRSSIGNVRPQVDGGRYPSKREVGDVVEVTADVFADGHDQLSATLKWRHANDHGWSTTPMRLLGNDRWQAAFTVEQLGRYGFAVEASVDRFATWRQHIGAKRAAGADLRAEIATGSELLTRAAARASGPDRKQLRQLAKRMSSVGADSAHHAELAALEDEAAVLMDRVPLNDHPTCSAVLDVVVDRRRARYGSWYEMFARSASPEIDRPGRLNDVIARLDYVRHLGFDVLYLPPVHPIGTTNRKGRNGAAEADGADPGSPWAIGSVDGGHVAIDPALGTLRDFDQLVERAAGVGVEIAMDLAFQCSPDHPWVSEHPEWFHHLPDGTIRYAENPPKKYEDIYPIDFETDAWQELWDALRSVVDFWVDRGIRTFRVDNPHTKPFRFWEWLIDGVKRAHPDVIFLAEAFTRPRIMEHLAKIGFSQSYTYFAWRNTKWEIESYLRELHEVPLADYFRPSFWPNTPDILTDALQHGGRPAFMSRLVLAATAAATYGIYGPAFELMEDRARAPGSEEYADSEKYEVRHWDVRRPDSLAEFVARVNTIRRSHPCLQQDRGFRLEQTDNDALVAYSKMTADRSDIVLVVVNLDWSNPQSGWVQVDLGSWRLWPGATYRCTDLLTGARYQWQGERNFVIIDPEVVPAHVLHVEPALGQRPTP